MLIRTYDKYRVYNAESIENMVSDLCYRNFVVSSDYIFNHIGMVNYIPNEIPFYLISPFSLNGINYIGNVFIKRNNRLYMLREKLTSDYMNRELKLSEEINPPSELLGLLVAIY